jgi:hypothetical protein
VVCTWTSITFVIGRVFFFVAIVAVYDWGQLEEYTAYLNRSFPSLRS